FTFSLFLPSKGIAMPISMEKRSHPIHPLLSILAGLIWIGTASPVSAQLLGNIGGVCIDAKGMLRDTRSLSPDDRLKLVAQEAVSGPHSEELNQSAPLRKVSLKRWEKTVGEFHKAGKPLPADVEHLAGLTSVQFVIFDPEHQDVILVGPAEPWKQTPMGEVVGAKSNRPVLHGEDLIAALRYAFAQKTVDPFIGCSIDPTPDGVQRYAAYMSRLGRMDRSRVKQIFAGMEQAMGPQAVRLFGVNSSSRFALVMLAADYRLKRIALGHDPSPVKEVTNYLDLAAKHFRTGPQKQHRWWFQAKYDAIYETPDHLAFELVGQGMEVVTAPAIPGQVQAVTNQTASPPAEEFAKSFTKHLTEIAVKHPIFAELQNLIALAVVAELIAEKHRQPSNATHWQPRHLEDEKACPVREFYVPKQVPSIANYRLIRNRHWLISVSGGVQISPDQLVRTENRDTNPRRPLTQIHEQIRIPENETGWWWDE
ncbi:MAG: DUF1598 domain-containing protein, partial [Planctomycetaceae bacterium]|nr:DUF1598 domain-containing protein [Planctomycetaceae bacterium]